MLWAILYESLLDLNQSITQSLQISNLTEMTEIWVIEFGLFQLI